MFDIDDIDPTRVNAALALTGGRLVVRGPDEGRAGEAEGKVFSITVAQYDDAMTLITVTRLELRLLGLLLTSLAEED